LLTRDYLDQGFPETGPFQKALVGGLEHGWIMFPYLGVMSSSQLTFTPSFFRGVGWSTTNQS